jgi:hypothetical protein
MTSYSRVLENLTYNRLLGLLNNDSILAEHFGFRKNLITEKAICELLNETVSALNGKLIMLGIFCDVAGGFVCVNHILLFTLNFYRITIGTYDWTKSYLASRYQKMEIKKI